MGVSWHGICLAGGLPEVVVVDYTTRLGNNTRRTGNDETLTVMCWDPNHTGTFCVGHRTRKDTSGGLPDDPFNSSSDLSP